MPNRSQTACPKPIHYPIHMCGTRTGELTRVSKPTSKTLAKLWTPSSVSHATAIVEEDFHDTDFLFGLVVYPSGSDLYLGIIEGVRTVFGSAGFEKRLRIKNLMSLKEDGRVIRVRNAPRARSLVRFASEDDLQRFFPIEEFPKRGYIGYVRDTRYPLPFDLDYLCFANTAILAGIGHGKSHLGALVASQLCLKGKRVLVVDPSGDWNGTIQELKEKLTGVGLDISSSYFRGGRWMSAYEHLFKTSGAGVLAILDVSFPESTYSPKDKLKKRCSTVCRIHDRLMRRASEDYARSKVPYGLQTCIILDEAHEFVPHSPMEFQRDISTLFSISTKEYRKFGLGHIFIDQSLAAMSNELQIQTYLLGATTSPTDLNCLRSQLGRNVASAAQRTVGGTETPSWVAYGIATPVNGIPWEIETFKPDELSILHESDMADAEKARRVDEKRKQADRELSEEFERIKPKIEAIPGGNEPSHV